MHSHPPISLSISLICPPGSSSLMLMVAKPECNIHSHSVLGTIDPDGGKWNQQANVLHGGSWAIRQLMCSGWGVHSQRRMQPLLAAWRSLVWLQDLSYCSIPAWPGWDLSSVSLAQITAWWHLRGPSPCSTCTVISSLLSLFSPWRKEVHLLFLSPLPHQEAHHCWTVFIIHWARR